MKLCTVKGNQKISKQLKFEVSNLNNKKSGQLSGFQKVWKILLVFLSFLPKIGWSFDKNKQKNILFYTIFVKSSNLADIFATENFHSAKGFCIDFLCTFFH